MQDLVRDRGNLARYRGMESLCRQRAVFHPMESWQLLAEAEMWHHKALAEICSCAPARSGGAPSATVAEAASRSRASDARRLSAD
jgi:hypothetical protein